MKEKFTTYEMFNFRNVFLLPFFVHKMFGIKEVKGLEFESSYEEACLEVFRFLDGSKC